MQEQSSKHLLSVQIRWKTFVRILMIITQGEKEKF